jgi:RNA polymerase sigma factor (sigma-70 family)
MAELLEQAALAALRPAVRALVARVLGVHLDQPDVDDCTGEAFRRALEGDGRRIPGSPLRPWVLGIARHVALDARRARARAKQRTEVFAHAHGEDAPEPLDRLPVAAPDPYEHAWLAERTQRLRRALGRLPEAQRRALMLHAAGHGYREIADELSIPIGTVCTWIARARQALALSMGDAAGEVSG